MRDSQYDAGQDAGQPIVTCSRRRACWASFARDVVRATVLVLAIYGALSMAGVL